ncbi:MAG: hypothetical protein ACKOEP_10660, partial [Phycisphaerales bacterium]
MVSMARNISVAALAAGMACAPASAAMVQFMHTFVNTTSTAQDFAFTASSDVTVNVKSCAVLDEFTNVRMNCTSAASAWAHAHPAVTAARMESLAIETTCPPPRGGHGGPFPSGQPMLVFVPFPKQ